MRIVVVQPVALPVGVVRWRGPMPRLTLVVKATLSFAGDEGLMTLAEEQEPLSPGIPVEGGEAGEALYPTDFVPLKSAADVILTGSAFSVDPVDRIDAMIRIGAWSRTFAAMAGDRAHALPLRAPYLRAPDGQTPIEVGARRVASPDADAVHGEGFDYGRFNAAPEAQRLPEIAPDARIGLRSLSPRAAARALRLPGLKPIVYVERDGGRVDRFDPVLDTLWIDTDRERCVVVYREDFRVSSLGSPDVDRVLIAFSSRDVEHEELLPLLPRVMPGMAVEPPILTMEAADEDEADELRMARIETWEHPPEPALPAETYARIGAELGEKREPREETLHRHGLDEDTWTIEELAWLRKLTAGVVSEDEEVATELGERMIEAQDALAAPHEIERTLADFAEICALLEDCEEPVKVLSLRGLTPSEYLRLDRRYTRAMERDPVLAEEFERRIAAARGAARGPEGDA